MEKKIEKCSHHEEIKSVSLDEHGLPKCSVTGLKLTLYYNDLYYYMTFYPHHRYRKTKQVTTS